ncbi:MAG: polysaccharide deacetylase family protein [Sphingomonas sp.]|uniref:polysaccharide deacetylase family protein n=1 Tax=Sphingomonas sp. TaxID=28214 RepID=UPI001ACE6174|nr:polysaccharide deacetylase family protein [Sphingomonas sp.]MBN8814720.1 polysaccharide deacetylase family protein [Sphingomonas sp.]
MTGESPSAPGFRPHAPASADLIDWPDAFGTRFVVLVDVEEEFDWSRPLSRDNRSVGATAALPGAHARFGAAGVQLAMMVDHPVATDQAAIDRIGPLLTGGSMVGAQLHPWVTPPFDEALTPRNSFAGNLPLGLEAAKIDQLTEAIVAAFGSRPVAYRAGRYGIGPATFDVLADRGYRLDCSMRPGFDYSAEGGPDFGAIGNHAFRAGQLIALPSTTVFTGMVRRGGLGLYRSSGHVPKGRALLARTGLLERIPLTPEGIPAAAALEAVRVAVGEGVRVLSFAFHSPSLAPGHTPYVRDEADLAAFWRWWDRVLAELDRLGVRPCGLAELIDAAGGPGRT